MIVIERLRVNLKYHHGELPGQVKPLVRYCHVSATHVLRMSTTYVHQQRRLDKLNPNPRLSQLLVLDLTRLHMLHRKDLYSSVYWKPEGSHACPSIMIYKGQILFGLLTERIEGFRKQMNWQSSKEAAAILVLYTRYYLAIMIFSTQFIDHFLAITRIPLSKIVYEMRFLPYDCCYQIQILYFNQ